MNSLLIYANSCTTLELAVLSCSDLFAMNIKQVVFIVLGLFAFLPNSHAQTENSILVQGTITFNQAPVSNVNIKILDSPLGTVSNTAGEYQLEAQIGQTIRFSKVGFKDVSIVVEDTSTTLNITLDNFIDQLDEVVVIADTPAQDEEDLQVVMNVKLKAPVGIFKPDAHGGVVYYLGPREINMLYNPDLGLALKDRYAGVKGPFTWMVDDIEWKTPPVIAYSEIAAMYVADIPVTGPTVFVRTKNAPEQIALRKAKQAEKYKNQNYYNNDAVSLDNSQYNNKAVKNQNTLRDISGKITYLESPLANVNIKVLGSSRGTTTDNKGQYSIQARTGEVLEYSHVSFKALEIVIEDITTQIDLEMIALENELDEVVIKVTTPSGDILTRREKAEKPFQTSRGGFDPKTAGYAIGVVDGDELSNTYSSIAEALKGKISGYQVGINGKAYLRGAGYSVQQDYPVAWEVDGVFTTDEPTYLDLTQIDAIYALKSIAATNKYGTLGAGGVIVIKTKFGDFSPNSAKRRENIAKYQNNDFYSNDAVAIGLGGMALNKYVKILKDFNDKQKAIAEYNRVLDSTVLAYSDQLAIATLFANYYKDTNSASDILTTLSNNNPKNPEIQKAIGYQFQALGLTKKAVDIFKIVARLRPEYAQSYRDLANARLENNQFKQAWRLYMSYLLMGNTANEEGIGKQIYSEMEYVFYHRSNQAGIKEKFVPISEDIYEFQADVRLVFEWNTSEAEFDIEFVNPELRSYVFQHDLVHNQDLIMDEKTKGYSSKEFYVDTIGEGEWLVNFTYKGNKKPQPTYVKLTVYYNWGKSYQTQEIRVYTLQEQRDKLQLLRLTKEVLVATN